MEAFECRRCQRKFTPDLHQWIFYKLCDHCFNLFDNQKMKGRFTKIAILGSLQMGLLSKSIPCQYYEDPGEWIKEHPYVGGEPDEVNLIQGFYQGKASPINFTDHKS